MLKSADNSYYQRVKGYHSSSPSTSSFFRSIPLPSFLGGWGLGLGLENNMIGAVWWALAVEALLGWAMLWTLRHSMDCA
jgi:hypothetical protein